VKRNIEASRWGGGNSEVEHRMIDSGRRQSTSEDGARAAFLVDNSFIFIKIKVLS
jgi:hypothetical protein